MTAISRSETAISRSERDDLLRVATLRERAAKTAAAQRSAELLADFEQQLASRYSFDQSEIWAKAYEAAEKAVAAANANVGEECEKLGIPKRFAPSIALHWYGRGENASKERRAELRKVAQTRIAAVEKKARAKIDQMNADVQIELIANGLSDAAKMLLEQMPRVDQLMPALAVTEAEALLEDRRGRR
jgi:hypothetical protein